MANAEIFPGLDIQVEMAGTELWLNEHKVPVVMANAENIVLTGYKMYRGQGVALEMTSSEKESITTKSDFWEQLENAAA